MKVLTLIAAFLFAAVVNAQDAKADTSLNEYTGQYKFPDGSAVTSCDVSVQSGELFISSAIGSASLTKISKDTFSIPSYNGNVYFYRTEGKVSKIKVEVDTLLLEGEKVVGIAGAYYIRNRALFTKP